MLGLVFLVMLPFWAIVEYKSLPFVLCSMDDEMDALDSIMIWPPLWQGPATANVLLVWACVLSYFKSLG